MKTLQPLPLRAHFHRSRPVSVKAAIIYIIMMLIAVLSSTAQDVTPPEAALSTNSLIPVDPEFQLFFQFQEQVVGFAEDDLIVTNGTVSNFDDVGGVGYNFFVDVIASDFGDVTITLPADAITDVAGNGNLIASITVNYRELPARIIGVGDGIFSFRTDDPQNELKPERRFHFNSIDHSPFGDLYQASDGSVWGLTYSTDDKGSIFKMDDNMQDIQFVHFFSGIDGEYCKGSLTEFNGALWGNSQGGGANNYGTIFKISLDGTGFEKVHDFDDTNGRDPGKRLVAYGNKLFGMTSDGGPGEGVLFSIDDEGNYEVIYEMSDASGYGGLIVINDRLWGLDSYGPNNGYGEIFSINPDGTDFQVYHDFESSATDGGEPFGDLVEFNGRIWGMNTSGGANSAGTIFSLMPDGTDYTVDHHFDGTNGGSPIGNLIVSNGMLWGMTKEKDAAFGTIFSYDPGATGYTAHHTFDDSNGGNPEGSLTEINGQLWGMTPDGGDNNVGTIFHIDTDGSNFTNAYSFGLWVRNAYAGLTVAGDRLFGVTERGGENDYGSIYSLALDGTDLQLHYSFDDANMANPNGSYPRGQLLEKDGKLYGLTNPGGTSKGIFYSINTDGTGFSNLFEIPSGNFYFHFSGLFLYNDIFYGIRNRREVFKINPDGTGYQVVETFPSTDHHEISLLDSEGKLWGIERNGEVFYYDINGDSYNEVHDFTTILNSSIPQPFFIENDGKIWSITQNNGDNSYGSIYTVDLDGTNFTTVHHFDQTNGSFPVGGLMKFQERFYGITRDGGDSSDGVLYSINTDGTNFMVIESFDGSNQDNPTIGSLMIVGQKPTMNQIPDLEMDEPYNGGLEIQTEVNVDLREYFFDEEDEIDNLYGNTVIELTGGDYIWYDQTNWPIVGFGTNNYNEGSSTEYTITITDSGGNEVSAVFNITVNPTPDGVLIPSGNYQGISYGEMSSDILVQRFMDDGDQITHFKVTAITKGQVLLEDGSTEVLEGGFVPFGSDENGSTILKFLGTEVGEGGFILQASTSASDDGLGGGTRQAYIYVDPAIPQISWAQPGAITYGDALTADMLNPTAEIAGTFSYRLEQDWGGSIGVAVGDVPSRAGSWTLYGDFYPDDNVNYYQTEGEVELVINKAPLTIRPTDIAKTYGDYTPSSEINFDGLVNGDQTWVIDVFPQVNYPAESVGVGEHTLTLSESSDDNYEITLEEATLTVTKAALVFNLDASRTYGDDNPVLTELVSPTGFVYGDDLDDLNTLPAYSTSATVLSPVGSYEASLVGGEDDNYEISGDGELTITKRDIEVWADDLGKIYGEENPELTLRYEGLRNEDTPEDMDVPVEVFTTASTNSSAGVYDIFVSGGSDNNYNFNYHNGLLTISKKSLTITAEDKVRSYGEENPALTMTYEGFVNGQDENILYQPPSISTFATSSHSPGVYSITLTGGFDVNYTYELINGNLTITKADQQVAFETINNLTYGDAPIDLSAEASSGLAVTFTSSDGSIISIDGAVATIVGAGTVTLLANQAGNSNYNEATSEYLVTVEKAEATITLADLEQNADGSPKEPTVTTDPENLNYFITFESGSAPSGAGSYSFTVTIVEDNYHGEETGTLVLKAPLGITEVEVNVYPNPVQNYLNVVSTERLNIQIVDLRGTIHLTTSEARIDVQALPAGMYLLRLANDKGIVQTSRFMKRN